MPNFTEVVIPVFSVLIIGFVAFLVYRQEQKRKQALEKIAHALDLSFEEGRDTSLSGRLSFLEKLDRGSNRYAYCVLKGEYDGENILIFDHHYQTQSYSKGRRRTKHHYHHFYVLHLSKSFPELTISGEGIFSKMAQFLGYEDIDFESHEFSKRYCVRSGDKKFAYDVCHARMMEYLLSQKDIDLEMENNVLCLGFNGKNDPKRVRFHLHRLVQIKKLLPDYLLAAGGV